MTERAVLLTDSSDSVETSRLVAVLSFFGVSCHVSSLADAIGGVSNGSRRDAKRLLCSPQALLEWVHQCARNSGALAAWREGVHSAFVSGGPDPVPLRDLVRLLADDPEACVREDHSRGFDVRVTEDMAELCGVMAGVQTRISSADPVRSVHVGHRSPTQCCRIIEAGDGAAFLRLQFHGVPVYLSAGPIVDLGAKVAARRFDVREHFSSAVPVAMYVRWAFPRTAWRAKDTNACLVIDDPLLKPRYGFFDFHVFSELMARERFATSVAFIPWNWQRSDSRVVGLFAKSSGRFSLCVHGCDHTAGEFGIREAARLDAKVALALERMERHRELTALEYDRVMVFPQGAFSSAALRALKHHGFIGAVNTGVTSTDLSPQPVTVADVWDTAVLNYYGFPVFTRRYPSEGLANFAFDLFLGKPCLVVIHHDNLHDRGSDLLTLIRGLNGLACNLSWRALGDVLRRSYRQRETSPGHVEVQMYGTEIVLDGFGEHADSYLIARRDRDAGDVDRVTLDSRPIAWAVTEHGVQAAVRVAAGGSGTVRVMYRSNPSPAAHVRDSLVVRAATGARRYASEFRDNYVTPGRYACRAGVERLRGLVGGAS